MQKQDIIVIGASAGGVQALKVIVAGFPENLEAAIFVALHIGPGLNGQSFLPAILSKAGPLPAESARHDERFQKGRIYVAPPDCHLRITPERIQLSRGPKENRTRPAINPLFRSAAHAYEGRVTGVILTGMLDDGVAGLAEIKRKGGVAIVQDPETAAYPSMPEHALQRVDVDHVLPLPQIARVLSDLATRERFVVQKEEPMERTPSALTCPECRGPLWEERQGEIVEYRCRVGHTYSALTMEAEHHDTVERSLWSSIVALEEAADIAEALAPELGSRAPEDARIKREQADRLRAMLEGIPSE